MEAVRFGGAAPRAGADLLIVDDPFKGSKAASTVASGRAQLEWFNSTLRAQAEPGASIVVIMTRWQENDLAGQLTGPSGERWETLRFPALAEDGDLLGRAPGAALCPERFDVDALAKIRDGVGSRVWSALYQQRPERRSGALLDRSWWRAYEQPPAGFDEIVQSWDLAFKDDPTSDFVVGQAWGRVGERKFLLEQVRGRMDFLVSLEAIRALAHRYPATSRVLIEDRANGCAALSALKESVRGLTAVSPDGTKLARVAEVQAEIEGGRVFLPTAVRAPWVEDFLSECTAFPDGPHDDQVDAMAYALKALSTTRNGG
jgi:predicted phage terminase large subunit-like protein